MLFWMNISSALMRTGQSKNFLYTRYRWQANVFKFFAHFLKNWNTSFCNRSSILFQIIMFSFNFIHCFNCTFDTCLKNNFGPLVICLSYDFLRKMKIDLYLYILLFFLDLHTSHLYSSVLFCLLVLNSVFTHSVFPHQSLILVQNYKLIIASHLINTVHKSTTRVTHLRKHAQYLTQLTV